MPITLDTFKDYIQTHQAELPRGGAIQLEGDSLKLSTTDKRWAALTRSDDDRTANNAIRNAFLQAVADKVGVSTRELQRLPQAVRKALNLDDYNLNASGLASSGKPLTAYRMQQVMNAIDRSGTELDAIQEENRARQARTELFGDKDPAEFLNEIPEEKRRFFQGALGDVKNEGKVRTAAGVLNKSRLARLEDSCRLLTTAMIKDLAQKKGLDLSAIDTDLFKNVSEKLRLKIGGSDTQKIFTEEELLLEFRQSMGKVLNAKAEMQEILQANAGKLSPAAMDTLTNAIKNDVSFKSPDVLRTLLDHLDDYNTTFDLLGQPDATEEMILQAFRQEQDKMHVLSQSLKRLNLDTDAIGAMGCLLVTVAKQNYLHSHGLEALPQPSQHLNDVANHLAKTLGMLAEISGSSTAPTTDGKHFASGKMLDNAIGGFAAASNFLQELGIEMQYSFGSQGKHLAFPDLTKAEAKYLNEAYGLGIRHDELNGEQFKQIASSKMMTRLNADLRGIVKKGEESTETRGTELWFTTAKDLVRPGIGMTLNGEVVMRPYDSQESTHENIDAMSTKVHAFFLQDQQHGLQAARILSQFLHQGMDGILLCIMQEIGELYDGCLTTITFCPRDFQVTRQQDGSYEIAYTELATSKDLVGSRGVTTLGGESWEKHSIKLKLSFGEDGKAKLTVTQKPIFEGQFRKSDFTEAEVDKLKTMKLPCGIKDYEVLRAVQQEPTLEHNQELKTLLAGDDMDALASFLEAHIIGPKESLLLELVGVPSSLIPALKENAGGQPLNRALVDKLRGTAEERQAATQQLQQMLQTLVDKGLIAQAPVLNPSMVALPLATGPTKAGSISNQPDAALLRDHLQKTGQLNLLEDILSGDQQRVESAKTKMQGMLPALRKETGDMILVNRYYFDNEKVNDLKERLGQARFDEMMEHVYQEDDQAQATVEALRQELQVMEQEQRAAYLQRKKAAN